MESLSFWADHQFCAENRSHRSPLPSKEKSDLMYNCTYPSPPLSKPLDLLFSREQEKMPLKSPNLSHLPWGSPPLVVELFIWKVATSGQWTLPYTIPTWHNRSLLKDSEPCISSQISSYSHSRHLPLVNFFFSPQFEWLQKQIFSFKSFYKNLPGYITLLVAGPTWPDLWWVTSFSMVYSFPITLLQSDGMWVFLLFFIGATQDLRKESDCILEWKLASATLFFSTWKSLHM